MALVLYRWHLDASAPDPRAERRRLVDTVVTRVFQDAAVLGLAECLYAGKYGPPYEPDEVRLTLLADEHLGVKAAAAVSFHLQRVSQRVGPESRDVLCRARARWYRGRLMDLTRVALDLHGGTAHQNALITMWGPTNSAALHRYFSTHSPVYRELCNTDEARAAFWREFWREGPDGLSYPGHWIENLVLSE